jgi:hypothetical protein
MAGAVRADYWSGRVLQVMRAATGKEPVVAIAATAGGKLLMVGAAPTGDGERLHLMVSDTDDAIANVTLPRDMVQSIAEALLAWAVDV